MLKWAVNSKRAEGQVPSRLSLESSGALETGRRRSLAGPHQGRRRNRRSLHNIDKENLDFIGCTPAFCHKELYAFRKLEYTSGALKDVSNLTPNSATPNSPRISTPNRRSNGYVESAFGLESRFTITPTNCVPQSIVPSQPFLKKRRILLDKEIYVDCADIVNEVVKIEDNFKSAKTNLVKNLSENVSSPSSEDVSDNNNIQKKEDIKSEGIFDNQTAYLGKPKQHLQRLCIEKPLANADVNFSTINATSLQTFEIEYSPCVFSSVINNNKKCPIGNGRDPTSCLSTLPVMGSRMFINNPLYFNVENSATDRKIPANKRSKVDFVDNFSAMLNKLSPMSALRQNGNKERVKLCSEVSPLARKMASLCFNRMQANPLSPEDEPTNAVKSVLEIKKRRPLLAMRDDELSIELETKTIGERSLGDESTITDSKMGDVTLEKMIEDILKSTKKVKRARKVKLHTRLSDIDQKIKHTEVVDSPKTEINLSPVCSPISPKSITNANTDIKSASVISIKEHFSESLDKAANNFLEQEKTFIEYDPFNCEREVKTPENRLSLSANIGMETMLKGCLEKCSLASMVKGNSRKRANSLGFTPTHNGSLPHDCDFNLKRQRCVRRKRYCHREETEETVSLSNEIMESGLTLKTGIPSPFTPENRSVSRILKSSSYNSITGYPFLFNPGDDVEYSAEKNSYQISDHQISSSPTLNYINYRNIPTTSVSGSSFMLGQISMEKKSSSYASSKMFGLTLECGIPSPTSPFAANRFLDLDTPGFYSSFLTDSSTQKFADDSVDVLSEPVTPVAEFRTSRRCLTYSPEEDDLRCLEMRSNLNNARSRQGIVQTQTSGGTVDLAIECRDDHISVHIAKCRNLQRSNGSSKNINAYVKVNISGMDTYQRTPVKRDCSSPQFEKHFLLPIPPRGGGRRIQVSVWHRDSQKRRSEFLGCMSFPVRHALRRALVGPFRLHAARPRRTRTAPAMAAPAAATTLQLDQMDAGTALAARLALQQREADDHLFLRYLELDPLEGPDAAPAAVQRKASAGGRSGRTPFTTTRRLDRGLDQGFGFSVLWTRPPRVERVDAGRAAERAGLYPGDYIVFVDRHNVVTMPESQVLTLIKSSGTQLLLETFRRSPGDPRPPASRTARGSVTSHATLSDAPYSPAPLPRQLVARVAPDATPAEWTPSRPAHQRPSTACSNNTARSDAAATSVASKKRPTQVAFTRESLSALGAPTASGSPSEMGRALHALILREQHYAQSMQFGVERFVLPMAGRTDILTPQEHKLLFQNCEELLRLSEDILEQLVMEDGEIHLHSVASVYLSKMPQIISLYKTYCNGLKRADCVLVQKSRQSGGAFTRLCTEPAIPSRRPDVTQLIHKPLEQIRELLRLLRAANTAVPSTHPDQRALARLVADLQIAYHDVTAGAGLMGPIGEGRPLLSVADLESRLVFTRCKPFVLAKPGRQWIFGGDLFRVEGRSCRSHWALLFSDLLLFATVSRDRVLFITEEPLPIANIAETCFSIRKRPTEFRIGVGSGRASSPTMKCGPPVRARTRTLVLRAPTADLKAVWQTLLLRQILRVNSSNGTPLSSPMESPAPLGCYSEVTLDSQQHQVTPKARAPPSNAPPADPVPRPSPCRGAALHLARWMKTHPGSGELSEPEPEVWSAEQLRKRSQELRLVDVALAAAAKQSSAAGVGTQAECNKSPSENERSPSRSTNSDSQITVRSSPVVPETVAVCRQCHKRCFSKPGSPQVSAKTPTLTDRKNLTSPVNNGFLSATHTCQNTYNIIDNKSECQNRCKKEICIAETKITSSPEKAEEKTIVLPFVSPTVSPRVAIRRSREEFFRNSESKQNCTSPFGRMSKSPSSQSPSSQKSSDSSRSTLFSTNSLMSFAHTTCSSMALSSSTKNTLSPERSSNASTGSEEIVQCVIAQERYLNEVKCVENVVLSKNQISRARLKEMRAYCNVTNTFEKSANSSPKINKYLASAESTSADKDTFSSFNPNFFSMPSKTTVNGDIRRCLDGQITKPDAASKPAVNFSWSPLMLMGLSSMNPAAHLLAMESENESPERNSSQFRSNQPYKPPTTSPTRVPNISVVPPTPDFKCDGKKLISQHTLEDSPDDSPVAEDPPYTALKRYGTMSSLERLPSDEIDDLQLNADQQPHEKDAEAAPGLMSWTSRAGSYVAEKMALLNSLAESGAASTGASFLERYLGTGEWRAVRGSVGGAEGSGGEGSGASGEEAWGTPSSGDLSDHAFPDSDHATLSSPTKSSSSCPGDDDTELMMDELLMTPPIAGPSLRPLLPRRRLEPLLEEDGSDSSSTSSVGAESEVTPSPTDKQESSAAGGVADGGARAEGGGLGWQVRGRETEDPELTPTNGPPGLVSPLLSNGSPPPASDSDRDSTCGSTASGDTLGAQAGPPCSPTAGGGARLSPRMEMRLALQEGRDILAEQDQLWLPSTPAEEMRLAIQEGRDILAEQDQLLDQAHARSGWVRRSFPLPRPRALGPLPTITSHSSASAQIEGVKVTAMERLAQQEARGGRRGGRRLRPTARLMGLVRRRASSDSPERRPYSPRRQQPHVSSHGYYKICFVNGFV